MVSLERTKIPDVLLIRPPIYKDSRGFFSETYNVEAVRKAGLDVEFVQDNHSLSISPGTVRGLHYQLPPKAQAKLVRVIRGAIYDVAVDIRRNSPSFGQHVAIELSATEWNQLFIPAGFAHGFCTLEPDTEVIYKCSALYSREHERSVLWRDPALGISWPVSVRDAILSDKDHQSPLLSDVTDFF